MRGSVDSPPVRALLRRLAPFLRPSLPLLLGAAFLSLLGLALDLAAPLLLKRLVDQVFAGGDLDQLDRIIGLFVAIYSFKFLADLVAGAFKNRFSEGVLIRIRKRVYQHVQGLSPTFFQEHRSGYLTSRILSDANFLGAVLGNVILGTLASVVLVAGAIAITASLNWRLTLVLLLIVPVLIALTRALGSRVRKATHEMQEQISQLAAGVQEGLSGISLVQSYTLEPYAMQRAGTEMEKLRQANVRVADLSLLHRTGAAAMTSVAGLAILWFGGRELVRGALTLGDLMAFLAYAVHVYRPVQELASLNLSFQSVAAAAARIFELLDERPGVEEAPDAVPLPAPVQGRVRFEGVCFAYKDDKDVLSGVAFEIEPGMKVAVVGRSGAGKTTLLNHLPRFHDPRAGRVEIDGLDVRSLTLPSLRSAVGIVSQDTFLFSGTIRDNLLCIRPGATEAELLAALNAAELGDFLERLPQGLDTEVGERGLRLSGGERQRLSIARVLLKDPPILILDEATSSIDSISENRIRAALDALMRSGRTCFVIAHRFTTILDADRILVLDEGRLVGQGRHGELYPSNPFYTRLYDEQFGAGAAEAPAATGKPGEGLRIEEFLMTRDGEKKSRIVVRAESSGKTQVEIVPFRS